MDEDYNTPSIPGEQIDIVTILTEALESEYNSNDDQNNGSQAVGERGGTRDGRASEASMEARAEFLASLSRHTVADTCQQKGLRSGEVVAHKMSLPEPATDLSVGGGTENASTLLAIASIDVTLEATVAVHTPAIKVAVGGDKRTVNLAGGFVPADHGLALGESGVLAQVATLDETLARNQALVGGGLRWSRSRQPLLGPADRIGIVDVVVITVKRQVVVSKSDTEASLVAVTETAASRIPVAFSIVSLDVADEDDSVGGNPV